MQLMASFRCVMVNGYKYVRRHIDISYNNVLRIYCSYSMQLATIVSTLVYTSIHLCAILNLCSRMRTTVQCSSTVQLQNYARYIRSRAAKGSLQANRICGMCNNREFQIQPYLLHLNWSAISKLHKYTLLSSSLFGGDELLCPRIRTSEFSKPYFPMLEYLQYLVLFPGRTKSDGFYIGKLFP